MASRKTLLHKLISALVEEWGWDEVHAALERVPIEPVGHSLAERAGISPSFRVRRAAERPNAAQLVERVTDQGQTRELLLSIAERFDRKQFLPSVADVREFLILSGERPRAMKDRTEGFRALLSVLTTLPHDRLQHLLSASQHSGPSQLGPISDAISAVGQRLPRYQQDMPREESAGTKEAVVDDKDAKREDTAQLSEAKSSD